MKLKFLKKIDKNTLFMGIAVVGIIVVGLLVYGNSDSGFSLSGILGNSDSKVANQVVEYINSNQLSQTPASLVSVSEESGLVKVKIKIGTSEFDSYATKDGKLLFPQAFDMSAKTENANAGQDAAKSQAQSAVEVAKADSPVLEAYVVSRCPYGLQMQRAMADAVKSVPSLAQYMKVRYIGSVSGNSITSMHGDDEAKENLRQICIRDEQPAKYWNYVDCQMKASGLEKSCEQSTGVDSAKLQACISDPSRGVADAKKDFELDNKYSIQGSPTLILNGGEVSENGFGGRSSDAIKSMICAGSNSPESFCSEKLNTSAAAVAFSSSYSGGAASSGNSGANGANCAPAQ